MDKNKVKVHIQNVSKILGTKRQTLSDGTLQHLQNELKFALIELSKPDWVSVEDELPQVDKEVIVLTTIGRISFGHIVNKKIAKDYNGGNIPDVEYWLPFVDPKDE